LGRFKDVVKRVQMDHKTDFSSMISVYGGSVMLREMAGMEMKI